MNWRTLLSAVLAALLVGTTDPMLSLPRSGCVLHTDGLFAIPTTGGRIDVPSGLPLGFRVQFAAATTTGGLDVVSSDTYRL